ncbi:MAG: sulfite exporter TauE/SafE family protein [Pseudomonadota bacterium]
MLTSALDALAAAAAQPAFWTLAVAGALAGLARGFSGFGAALIFMPAASAAVGPQTALITLWIADAIGALTLLPWGLRHCGRAEVGRLALGLVCGVPAGIWVLTTAAPEPLRWGLCLAALAVLAALGLGLRWTGPLPRAAETGVGFLSGFGGGVAGLSGVAPVIFYLGREAGSERLRANIIALFAVSFPLGGALLAWNGLFTAEAAAFGVLLTPLYALAIRAGAFLYPRASQRAFQRLAFALIAASALAGLPVWD